MIEVIEQRVRGFAFELTKVLKSWYPNTALEFQCEDHDVAFQWYPLGNEPRNPVYSLKVHPAEIVMIPETTLRILSDYLRLKYIKDTKEPAPK